MIKNVGCYSYYCGGRNWYSDDDYINGYFECFGNFDINCSLITKQEHFEELPYSTYKVIEEVKESKFLWFRWKSKSEEIEETKHSVKDVYLIRMADGSKFYTKEPLLEV